MDPLKITCPTCKKIPGDPCNHKTRVKKANDWRSETLGDKWWESKPANITDLSNAIKGFNDAHLFWYNF